VLSANMIQCCVTLHERYNTDYVYSPCNMSHTRTIGINCLYIISYVAFSCTFYMQYVTQNVFKCQEPFVLFISQCFLMFEWEGIPYKKKTNSSSVFDIVLWKKWKNCRKFCRKSLCLFLWQKMVKLTYSISTFIFWHL